MTGTRETQCTSCVHRSVCMYKDNFLSAHDAIRDVTVYLGDNSMIRLRDIQWIEPVALRCKNYYAACKEGIR